MKKAGRETTPIVWVKIRKMIMTSVNSLTMTPKTKNKSKQKPPKQTKNPKYNLRLFRSGHC
jgi:hypothetical protein